MTGILVHSEPGATTAGDAAQESLASGSTTPDLYRDSRAVGWPQTNLSDGLRIVFAP